MPQHIRTARPSGDIRDFPWTVNISGGVSEGQIYKIHDTFCVAFQDAAVGEEVTMHYHVEKIMLPKVAAIVEAGQKLYHSGVNGTPVTPAYQSGYYWIAIAVADAAVGDAEVKADLKGDKASLTEPL